MQYQFLVNDKRNPLFPEFFFKTFLIYRLKKAATHLTVYLEDGTAYSIAVFLEF